MNTNSIITASLILAIKELEKKTETKEKSEGLNTKNKE